MQVPLEVVFHGLDRSESLEANVRQHASKLAEFSDRLTSCHVVLEKPHRHHRQGNTYHVRIRVAVPRRELVVDREPEANHAHEDPYVTVRDAFKAMRRQIDDYVRETRGNVETHAQQPRGHVLGLVPDQGFGAKPSAPPQPPSEETIRARAYELWEAAGRPEGDGICFWLEAERELSPSA